ncbi:hypothetical protein QR680_016697 [Steinernema hermaphroditum]|uniref:7TM GPCR serpentine receptor class x (Srx) domain-containing protein n=1 Tax=Steinernema hermaphroditum TaxID=289476 RepID=A0AA39LMR9_9BILA|nr:hypothetical protein QR680_016697 [Steinernema hermaphroditum]
MELYVFRHDEYRRLYNCSFKTRDEWGSVFPPNYTFGSFCLLTGTIYAILYVPVLRVMLRPELFQNSCFKIMFYFGLIDFFCIFLNCFLTGFLSIEGAVACSHMDLIYVTGCFCVGLWSSQCLTCVVLVFNRCVDISSEWLADVLFSGYRTFLWILLTVVYMLYFVLFNTPILFSSLSGAWFFDPYVGIPNIAMDRSAYGSYPAAINNLLDIVLLLVLHTYLFAVLWCKTKGYSGSQLRSLQVKVIMQSFFVCFVNFTCAALYCYMQYFSAPMFLVVVAQIAWQLSNGGVVIIYIMMNKTIRNGVLNMIFCHTKNSTITPVVPIA